MDQGSAPTLKWIFGQGFPKLHPFGLSPLIPDPSGSRLCLNTSYPMDQGSVLDVRTFGSLSIYFVPQPEVVPLF